MARKIKHVYCKCYCVTEPGCPKILTGIYYAKKGTTGIWYWQRKLNHAFVFEEDADATIDISDDAIDAEACLEPRNISGCLLGFVRVPKNE